MKYKKVKKIEEEISVIGLGCWAFAGEKWWNKTDDKNSINIIREAIDNGVNLFDVAAIYGLGHSEEVLGKAIKGYDRSKLLINSKCGLVWDENNNVYNNLKKESLLKEINESLQRLDTDYIDIYQLHWPDPNTPIEETLEALQIIKDSGKIKYVGVTNYSLKETKKIMKTIDIVSQQGLYNMLERNPKTYHAINLDYRTEKEILPYVEEQGQAFFPYSPLFQGLLAGEWDRNIKFSKNDVRSENPKLTDINRFSIYYDAMIELKKISESYGHKMNELALNWLIDKKAITSVIASCLTVDEINSNMDSLKWNISDEMYSQINPILEKFENI